jgi:hypothetical protein
LTQATGIVGLTYPNGVTAALSLSTVRLDLCATAGCTTVTATLTQTGPGAYTYSFPIPLGLSGTVTVILPAGSLTDTYGTGFPAVNTSIGTFTVGSASASTGAPALAASSVKYSKMGQSAMHTTQPLEQASQPQINTLLPALLTLLSILGVALVALPKKA